VSASPIAPRANGAWHRSNLSLRHHPETEVIVAAARPRPLIETAGGPALTGAGAPGATPDHVMWPCARSGRVDLGRGGIIPGVVPVLAPLPNVAVHVIKAPGVRPLKPHRVCRACGGVAGSPPEPDWGEEVPPVDPDDRPHPKVGR